MVEAAGYSGASDDYYEVNPTLDPENIAAGVLFMLGLPYKVQVLKKSLPTNERRKQNRISHSFNKILTLFYHNDSFVIRLRSLRCDQSGSEFNK